MKDFFEQTKQKNWANTAPKDKPFGKAQGKPVKVEWKKRFRRLDNNYDKIERGNIGRGIIDDELEDIQVAFIRSLLQKQKERIINKIQDWMFEDKKQPFTNVDARYRKNWNRLIKSIKSK